MPPVYDWLAAQPDSIPLLELPVQARESMEGTMDLRRQMYVLYHEKPRVDEGRLEFVANQPRGSIT